MDGLRFSQVIVATTSSGSIGLRLFQIHDALADGANGRFGAIIASERFLVPMTLSFSVRVTSGQLAKQSTVVVEFDDQFQFSTPAKPRRPPSPVETQR